MSKRNQTVSLLKKSSADEIDESESDEETEQAALEWLFDVAFPHLAPPEDQRGYPEPFAYSPELKEDFEALCDAAFDTDN